MDHVAGPFHIWIAEKERRIWFNIICLKLYQFKRITWWCLFVLESAPLEKEKEIKKVMVSWNLHQAHLLEVNLTQIPGDHETLSIVRHVGPPIDFSSMKSSLDL